PSLTSLYTLSLHDALPILFLAHVERQDLRRCVVFLRHAQDGMPQLVNPLVEEPIELLPSRLFNGSAKLFGLHRLMRVLGQVMIRSEEHTSELQSQSNLVCR